MVSPCCTPLLMLTLLLFYFLVGGLSSICCHRTGKLQESLSSCLVDHDSSDANVDPQRDAPKCQHHYHLQKGNYRGIVLLSIARKILARVLLNRLLPPNEKILSESQCGFRSSRETTNMIFVARQIQEIFLEHKKDLYMTFNDLTDAFVSINQEALWNVLSRFGCPANFITIMRLLDDKITETVLINGAGT